MIWIFHCASDRVQDYLWPLRSELLEKVVGKTAKWHLAGLSEDAGCKCCCRSSFMSVPQGNVDTEENKTHSKIHETLFSTKKTWQKIQINYTELYLFHFQSLQSHFNIEDFKPSAFFLVLLLPDFLHKPWHIFSVSCLTLSDNGCLSINWLVNSSTPNSRQMQF